MIPILVAAGIVFVCLMFYQAYRGQMSYQSRDALVVTARAKLLRKEFHVSTRVDAAGSVIDEDVRQLVFSLDTEGEMSFRVEQNAFERTPVDVWGALTYQGTQFLGFEFRASDAKKD
jgi:hypothetical protein